MPGLQNNAKTLVFIKKNRTEVGRSALLQTNIDVALIHLFLGRGLKRSSSAHSMNMNILSPHLFIFSELNFTPYIPLKALEAAFSYHKLPFHITMSLTFKNPSHRVASHRQLIYMTSKGMTLQLWGFIIKLLKYIKNIPQAFKRFYSKNDKLLQLNL